MLHINIQDSDKDDFFSFSYKFCKKFLFKTFRDYDYSCNLPDLSTFDTVSINCLKDFENNENCTFIYEPKNRKICSIECTNETVNQKGNFYKIILRRHIFFIYYFK